MIGRGAQYKREWTHEREETTSDSMGGYTDSATGESRVNVGDGKIKGKKTSFSASETGISQSKRSEASELFFTYSHNDLQRGDILTFDGDEYEVKWVDNRSGKKSQKAGIESKQNQTYEQA